MLKKNGDGLSSSFFMEMTQASTAVIQFQSIIDFFKSSKALNKLIFIDPIVLAKQPRLLELEAQQHNTLLVPTNIQESSKNLESVVSIIQVMEDRGIGRRNELICAIGGGALMDTVSFAASIYRRGISVTKIPTTLLGIVDAAVGIKTGVNFEGQRNRLGSYHFDFDVVIDPTLLHGIGKGMLRQGLGEIFKIATIKGRQLFSNLKSNISRLEDDEFYQSEFGIKIISDAIELMLEELHNNPRESNLKRSVDFGHSFCPLVEMESLKRTGSRAIPHGFAVAYDCVLTTALAYKRQRIGDEAFKEIVHLFQSFDFDFSNDLYKDTNLLWASFLELTKHRGMKQNLPIPVEIGAHDFLQDVNFDEVEAANNLIQREFNL